MLRSATRREEPFSPALPAPQITVLPEEDWGSSFAWNPHGQGLVLEDFNFAIVRASEAQNKELRRVGASGCFDKHLPKGVADSHCNGLPCTAHLLFLSLFGPCVFSDRTAGPVE